MNTKSSQELLSELEELANDRQKMAELKARIHVEKKICDTKLNGVSARIIDIFGSLDMETQRAAFARLRPKLLNETQAELDEAFLAILQQRYGSENLLDEKLSVYFDQPKLLQVMVGFPNGGSRVVDVIKSIESDVSNMGHPIIVKAVQRYRQLATFARIRTDKDLEKEGASKRAKYQRCLERIAEAIVKVEELKPFEGPIFTILGAVQTAEYDTEYFQQVINIVKSPVFKESVSASAKASAVHRGLKSAYPDLDHEDVIKWLKWRLKTSGLPRRLDPRIFRIEFFAFKWNVEPSTAKVHLSRTRKKLEPLPKDVPLFEGIDLESMFYETVYLNLGIYELSAQISLNGLATS